MLRRGHLLQIWDQSFQVYMGGEQNTGALSKLGMLEDKQEGHVSENQMSKETTV